MKERSGRTAAQEIVLAADDLTEQGSMSFSEWDLTVAAWKRDKNRFGCRGYEDKYPDHKRVMMEIMGQSKRDNPIRRQFVQKTKTNYYQLTPLGKAEADRLKKIGESKEAGRSPGPIFTAVEPYVSDRSFRAWLEDPEEPRTWLGASAFLGLRQNERNHLNDRIRAAITAVDGALDWCTQNSREVLNRGTHGGGSVARGDLEKLRAFIDLLQTRFAAQMNAIRRKGA
jgi:hypothetical protein